MSKTIIYKKYKIEKMGIDYKLTRPDGSIVKPVVREGFIISTQTLQDSKGVINMDINGEFND